VNQFDRVLVRYVDRPDRRSVYRAQVSMVSTDARLATLRCHNWMTVVFGETPDGPYVDLWTDKAVIVQAELAE
jgi:hypothetical protein